MEVEDAFRELSIEKDEMVFLTLKSMRLDNFFNSVFLF